jgi:hypothetical protein
MLIDEAKLDMGWLCLKVQPADALRWLVKFKQGKDYEIKQVRQKRSLDANAFCFVLLDKLSEALQTPKEELYRRYIREIGGVSDIVCVPTKAVDRLVATWESNGLGWQAEPFPSKLDGCTNVILYYGSSTYDTKQMSRLIDSIVQDCHSIGIETRSPEEIESLLKGWSGNDKRVRNNP